MTTLPLLRIGCAAGFSGHRTGAAAPRVKALIDAGRWLADMPNSGARDMRLRAALPQAGLR